MRIALTRAVPDVIGQCELTHIDRRPIDVEVARIQHAAYEDALRALGCRVERVPAAPGFPDSVFVEDTAVVLPEVAIVTRPGAASRRAEIQAVAEALIAYRQIVTIEAPGTVDGGDVLVVGKALFIGLTDRTNAAGIEQMQRLLSPYGYTVTGAPVRACLHLKSAVTQVNDQTLLIQPRWIEKDAFSAFELIEVDVTEAYAANVLRIGERVIYPSAFPRTAERLAAQGIEICLVDADELAKAEGAVTCCSLVFEE